MSDAKTTSEMLKPSSRVPATTEQPKLHPFPARMAPDIALRAFSFLPSNSIILDPMCGSGTVLLEAARNGHDAIGFDVDPLAVLIARVRSRPLDPAVLMRMSSRLVDRALQLDPDEITLPWMDEDPETRLFVDYWFAPNQQQTLRSLAWL